MRATHLGPVVKGSGTRAQVEFSGVVPADKYVPMISMRDPLRNSSHVRCVKLRGVLCMHASVNESVPALVVRLARHKRKLQVYEWIGRCRCNPLTKACIGNRLRDSHALTS